MKWDSMRVCMAAAATLLGLAPGLAVAAQLTELSRDLCAEATATEERSANIPQHLLKAISLAEAGRWDDRNRANIAWPWTVTAQGEGRYFPTKAAAVRYVRKLKAEGVRNIDVGCMQVNLFYHGDAFPGLEQALDPEANVAYASQFLKNHFAATGSWMRAAGNYHSATPKLGAAYRKKVVRLWRQERKVERAEERRQETGRERLSGPRLDPVSRPSPPPRQFAAVDRNRTARLNAGLRKRRARERTQGADGAAVRRGQLSAWRSGRSGTALTAAVQRARVLAERRRKVLDLDIKDRKKRHRPLRWTGGTAGTS